ncbi:lantibiotic dehydratase [Chitinophaga sp. Hz27]|uniref:lantibiotic dehydratase n=1 Tax=Chitinophaga sp. Hz27 TaxID=3347169 RepID=UPI0035DA6081
MICAENFFAVRTPLLPADFILRLEHLTPETLPAAMKEIFQDPLMQDAIYIASPELFQEMQRWLNGEVFAEKEEAKLSTALYRYILRMSSRCTPYGLFAGCATGIANDYTKISLSAPQQHRRHCRLDMNYVAELAASIVAIPEVKEQLLFYPNNSLYKSGNRYRYAAYSIKNKFRNYFLTAVNSSDYLEAMLELAANGATLEAIRQSVVSEENDITWYDAAAFTDELIANQLLVSELEATVTGEEFFHRLLRRLEHIPAAAGILPQLHAIASQLQTPGLPAYLEISRLVKELLPGTSSKDLLQTDLFLHTEQAQLSATVLSELSRQSAELLQLAKPGVSEDLEKFITAFSSRYEEQEVPLNLALDTEAGIGYGAQGNGADHTPLLDDLVLPGGASGGETIQRSKMLEFQIRQLRESASHGWQEIKLTAEDLATLTEKSDTPFPGSLYLMGKVMAASSEAIDAGDYTFDMSGISGPSAANLLGRFCHGDTDLAMKVQAALRREEALEPDAIYAEIVHLPESRTGNILMRPRLRDYEIVYLAASEAPKEMQIHIDDLMVSIRGGKVRLRSKRLNKWIIPRLSTAHNYRNGLGIYKFLCELQHQDYRPGFSWQWLVPDDWTRLPRVSYGKIILNKNTWSWRKDKSTFNRDRYMDEIKAFRERWELPRFVVLVEGDNELLLDLDNAASCMLLGKSMEKQDRLMLQEYLQTPDQCWVTGDAGKYTNEVIIPLFNDAGKVALPPLQAEQDMVQRAFVTGSEWLYVKLYCGTRTAEDMLKEIVLPLVTELQEEAIIDKWFFIRYTDPDHHLRMRFHHAGRKGFWAVVLERLYEKVNESGNAALISRIQTDTYTRELERYGNTTMEFSETVFHIDSDFVLGVIDLLDEEAGEDYRWLMGVAGTDQLLDIFGFSLKEKAHYMQQLQQGFFKEFKGDKDLMQLLNDKFRKERGVIVPVLSGALPEEVQPLFMQRSSRLQEAIASSGNIDKYQLLSSYIHMFLNRILLAGQRRHELVIYHFLDRHYQSALARANKQQPATN